MLDTPYEDPAAHGGLCFARNVAFFRTECDVIPLAY